VEDSDGDGGAILKENLRKKGVVMLTGFKGIMTGPCGNFLYLLCKIFRFENQRVLKDN
jgi:hypothetical protein